jgi:fermentation-respiration switch protein FrsA (DUF1100 family)
MTIFAILVGTYIVVCCLAFLFQSQLMHFPDRKMAATPGVLGMDYQDVFFETGDGIRLHGWFIPRENAKAIVLFCHGNAGNISHRLDSIHIFWQVGLSVFIFDYRSYGRSQGRVSEDGLYADARAAVEYLLDKKDIAPDQIIYFGRSLGSAIAIELASHYPPLALIAESAFTSMPELGSKVYPWLPVKFLCRFHYDSAAHIKVVMCPKLFIHSRQDDIVPFSLGRKLYDNAPEPKDFLEISGSHNDGFLTSGMRYIDGLTSFLDSLEQKGYKAEKMKNE